MNVILLFGFSLGDILSCNSIMYGITREQLTDFFLELQRASPLVATDTDLRRLSFSLAMCALNCTWEQLYDLQPMWIAPETPPLSIRTLRDDFSRIADLCRSPALMNPKLRFKHGVSWMSDVTCMMDVTTIPCRARKPRDIWDEASQEMRKKDATYSGKHREHCFKVEFWLTLAGVPIFFRGPVPGSVHDAKIYKERTTHGTFLFDHHDEMFLADLGYVDCNHCFVPFKAPRKGCLDEHQDRFNRMHSWIRSRIERCFAHFDKFRFCHGTDHDITWVKDAVQIVSVAVYGLLASEPQYDFGSEINVHLQNIDDSSFCWCSKGCGLVKPIDERRDWLKEHIYDVGYVPKKPQHGSKTK